MENNRMFEARAEGAGRARHRFGSVYEAAQWLFPRGGGEVRRDGRLIATVPGGSLPEMAHLLRRVHMIPFRMVRNRPSRRPGRHHRFPGNH